MARNIVVCCDGTGNEFGENNSNVVKLYQVLSRDALLHAAYYHPGVGTMGAKSALSAAGKAWTKTRGLAFGYGLSENIADAYRYLMHTYEPGDRLYIFGFSRGAYTARALCGLLQMFGLLSPGNEGLIPYALRLFKRREGRWARWRGTPSKFEIANQFRKTFSRDCRPHFLGVWDTVSSVGWILDPFSGGGALPYTYELGQVSIVRHAVSIDERRAFFRQNLVKATHPDLKQVWFTGVHSDVGGGYPEAESGLSKIALGWMIAEAAQTQLLFDQAAVDRMLGARLDRAKPSVCAELHNSLTPLWWVGEFWPKRARGRGLRFNLFRRRTIPAGATLHDSALQRQARMQDYRPSNLPVTYRLEPDTVSPPYPVRLAIGETLEVGVFAREKWNDTAVELRPGETYRFAAAGRWRDATIPAGPEGYPSPSRFFRWLERLRRRPSAPWFALVGDLDRRPRTAFTIERGCSLDVTDGGVLQCWANDLPFMYWNNSGWVTLRITREK